MGPWSACCCIWTCAPARNASTSTPSRRTCRPRRPDRRHRVDPHATGTIGRPGRRHHMRVMLMIKGDPQPGAAPSEELLSAMGSYNDELKQAGVLMDVAGLLPSEIGST